MKILVKNRDKRNGLRINGIEIPKETPVEVLKTEEVKKAIEQGFIDFIRNVPEKEKPKSKPKRRVKRKNN